MVRTRLNIGCRYSTPVLERPLHPTRSQFKPQPSQTQAPVTPATEPERRAGGGLTTVSTTTTSSRLGWHSIGNPTPLPHCAWPRPRQNRPPGRRSAAGTPPRTGRQVPHGRQRIYVVRPTRCRPVMEFEACAKSSSGSYSGVLVDEVFSGMNERTDILVAGLRRVGTIFLRHPANIADAVSSSGAGTFGDVCGWRFAGSLI